MSGDGTLLQKVAACCRVRRMSIRTERAYSNWIEQFLRFHRDGGRTACAPTSQN
ncbi:MAG: phage integrase N-terminal SAM-like domain-containing protein [Planctomycetales bacterium]|nr:phage integrase N-terminal SAM-like domain-containing protein [Planctomycetales bacterium]